jgi:hypothetical protein
VAKDKRFQSHAVKEATLNRRRPRTEERKRLNRVANEAAAARNRDLRARGELTPHEAKKAARKARRDALRAAGQLPPIGTSRSEWERKRKRASA